MASMMAKRGPLDSQSLRCSLTGGADDGADEEDDEVDEEDVDEGEVDDSDITAGDGE